MFRSRSNTTSLAKAARELERQIMTMEVVSGDEAADLLSSSSSSSPLSPSQDVPLPDRLAFGPYGITPLRGLHFNSEKDTAAS